MNLENELREIDRRHLWHPFTPMRAWRSEDFPVIVRGEGSYLFDSGGRRYLDGVSSLWVTVHGHSHPHINRAIIEQVERISHSTMLGLSSEPACRLAVKLVGIAPEGLTRVFFSDNGSTAVEVALKMAFQYRRLAPEPGERRRTGFISFRNAYHGDTLGAVSVGGIELFHSTFRDLLFRVDQAEYPYYYRHGPPRSRESYLRCCLESLENLMRTNREHVGAVVIEPLVQGAGGMITSGPGFLAGVRELCDRYEMLLIADEVATGFGRTGRMWACDHERVSPDFLCCAKGLTGGYLPMAATLAAERIYERFLGGPDSNGTFYHGHSFTGNQLAAAAALASLELFERERVIDSLQPKISLLARTLQLEVAPLEHVGDIRQCGFMVGIELVADRSTRESFDPGLRIGHRVTLEARKRGVIIRPLGDVVVLMPHLSFSEDELLKLVQTAAESICAATSGAMAV